MGVLVFFMIVGALVIYARMQENENEREYQREIEQIQKDKEESIFDSIFYDSEINEEKFETEKYVIGKRLMIALGYSEKVARGQFVTQLRKLVDYNPMFGDLEYRKATHILTIDEAKELLIIISRSKSKYKDNARELLRTGLDNSILTYNDAFVDPVDIKKPKRKTTKELKDEVVSLKEELEKLQNKLKELEIN